MFDIIFRKKKIYVDCFTVNPAIAENFPILSIKEYFPEWWKQMPTTLNLPNQTGIIHPVATIKRCDGILSLYQEGFCMPLWSDLIIETNKHREYRFLFSGDETPPIINHAKEQMGPAFNNLIHVKILSPWLIEEKTGVKFHYAPAIWNLLDYYLKINILSAIVNFRNQSATHINALIPIGDNRIEFSAGQPLIHLLPITEDSVILKNHVIGEEEFRRKQMKFSYASSFLGKYKKNISREKIE